METASLSWPELWDQIVASYTVDTKLEQLCKELQTQPELHSKYSWDGLVLRRLRKIVLVRDEQLGKHIFDLFHGGSMGSHLGTHATRHKISSLLHSKGLSKDVKRWVRECVICQRCKVDNSTSIGLL